MTPSTVVLYAAQVAVVVAVAGIGIRSLPIAPAAARVTFWRGVIAACLAVPVLSIVLASVSPVSAPAAAVSRILFTVTASDAMLRAPVFDMIPVLLGAGALLRLLWLALGVWRLRWLRRTSTPIACDVELDALRDAIAPRARWGSHAQLHQPLTFGWRHPLVLLPASFARLARDTQRAVACHELLHVARRDWVWTLGEELVRCAFWFHPAVRWALDQLALSREQRIDEAVIERTAAGRDTSLATSDYVHALLAFADAGASRMPALPFGGRHDLVARVRNLYARRAISRRVLAWRRALLAASLASVTALVACVSSADPVAPQQPLRMGSANLTPPRVLHEVRPVYSAAAMQAKATGTVLLDVTIAADGTVSDTKVIRSIPLLDQQAIDAARQWRFQPGQVKGKAVPVAVSLEFTFTLK